LRDTAAPEVAKHCRTPKRGRARKLAFRTRVLECGGAPPLFILYSSRLRACVGARVRGRISQRVPGELLC
jgi:hypothetical protein